MSVSPAFALFGEAAPGFQQTWMAMVRQLAANSALDTKTEELAYLAVLAATGLESGLPFHVSAAVRAGATRDEVVSALLVGLPAAGQRVVSALPIAVATLDELGA